MSSLGFIGAGYLAAFFVEGLSRGASPYAITVSPRNAAIAEILRARFRVTVAADNQAIVDSCDLIVVSLLPQQARSALAPLKFRKGQTVLSVMAGIDHSTIHELVAPAVAAIAMMPGHANARGAGPSVLYPENAAVRALLQHLGPVHVYETEAHFMTASVMGAFSGMSLLLMKQAIDWFVARRLGAADARALVAEVVGGNAAVLRGSPLALDEITSGVATPGGITEQGWRIAAEGRGWPAALDAVLRRISQAN